MKFRLTERTSALGGSIFNVYYKQDTPPYARIACEWVYMTWFYSEAEARAYIAKEINLVEQRERVIQEFDSEVKA